jgi:hypothetical protein
VPPQVQLMGFSWGAFTFTWIWGCANRVWAPLVLQVIAVGINAPLWNDRWNGQMPLRPRDIFQLCEGIGWLAYDIWLGDNGHRLAWQHRRFASYQQFVDAMRVWNIWGIACWVPVIVLTGFLFLLLLGLAVGTAR